ncbi:hypothetical protein [Tepidimicrobium xylanilyticum]|nr:hypothetical protein [Tepidimicrobium xylanilyticum]
MGKLEDRLYELENNHKTNELDTLVKTVKYIEEFLDYSTRGFYGRSKSR